MRVPFLISSRELRAVKPSEITGYLGAHEWKEVLKIGREGALWVGGPDDDYEVLVPLDLQLVDFVHRVADLLTVLSMVEARSQAEVYRDICACTGFENAT